MDFLDPKKQKRQAARLMTGYILLAVALVLAAVVLMYQAYGFGVGKNGQVIQNGFVFVSSQPGPAAIYVNGARNKAQTNARLQLPAGQYTLKLQRTGYRVWQRAVSVEGGSVEHFDYPFLFPAKLTTSTVKKYAAMPALALQSPDRRWLLVQTPGDTGAFDEFDLNNPKSAPKTVTIPASVFTAGDSQAWQLGEWSTDNRHVLLKHSFVKDGQAASEYVMLDRQDPAQSFNLATVLNGVKPDIIQLRDKAYDQYYLYNQNQSGGQLSTASLKQPAPQPMLDHVLAFKPYGSNMLLYATDMGAPAGQVLIKLRQGDNTYTLRRAPAGTHYLLDLAQYSGSWYVAAGAANEDKVYVYKDPVATLAGQPGTPLVPAAILKVTNPAYVQFSANTQFVMAESGTNFAVYDAENQKSYHYHVDAPLDAPQAHATWMDGDRLTYVANGKVTVFDYDSTNRQTLSAADPGALPFFDQKYKVLYTIAPQSAASVAAQASGSGSPAASDGDGASPADALTSTPLLTPADQ